MFHTRLSRSNNFVELTAEELPLVSGGVVSFTDGTAQERRAGAQARYAQNQAIEMAMAAGLLGDDSLEVGSGSSPEGRTIISEDFNGDGQVDAISEIDSDGNWVQTIGLTEEYDNWIAATQLEDGTVPWHQDAVSTFTNGTGSLESFADNDGSFYGGGGIALVTGGMFGLSEGGNHAGWLLGIGGILEFGYSTDDANASSLADNTELQLPGIYPHLDLDPFTIGVQINTGIFISIAELHKDGSEEPDPDGGLPSEYDSPTGIQP